MCVDTLTDMTTRTERLMSEPNIWFAAVRADGRPHLTPIWFVWVDDKAWLCTQRTAVKARLVSRNPQVTFALENGNAPVTAEGIATLVDVADAPDAVVAAFNSKYQWDITTDEEGYGVLIAITVAKWLHPGGSTVE